jgi:hypothetical protein
MLSWNVKQQYGSHEEIKQRKTFSGTILFWKKKYSGKFYLHTKQDDAIQGVLDPSKLQLSCLNYFQAWPITPNLIKVIYGISEANIRFDEMDASSSIRLLFICFPQYN